MLDEGDSVLVCVSGGPDSVCLLHLLIRFRKKLGLGNIGVAHVNYGTRGEESDEDERFVRSLCDFLGVPVFVKKLTGRESSFLKKGNFQERARVVRYKFFREISSGKSFTKIATAHTRDDQAETVLMRFLSGSGIAGLKGIPPVTEEGFIRPLIEISKEEVIGFLDEEGLSYRIDRTNLEGLYERNRFRNEVIPLLEEVTGKDVRAILAREAQIFRQVDELLNELVGKGTKECFKGQNVIDVGCFSRNPELVRKSILQVFIRENTGREPASKTLERADELLTRDFPSFCLSLPGGFVLTRDYGEAKIVPGRALEGREFEIAVDGPGLVELGEGRGALRISVEERGNVERVLGRIMRDRNVAAFEYREGFFPLTLRSFRPGDRIVPFGRKTAKKLKSIFIERRVPREVRREIPIVISSGEIIWVPGVVRSRHLPIVDGTQKIIVLEYNRS